MESLPILAFLVSLNMQNGALRALALPVAVSLILRCCRRGIIVYIEYQSVCPFVVIGSPRPLPRKLVWLPPRIQVGGRYTRLRGKGWGEGPNSGERTETYIIYIIP